MSLEKPGSSLITQRQNQEEHNTGKDGVERLSRQFSGEPVLPASEKTGGKEIHTLDEYFRTPKGQEFLHTPKIVLAGAPKSGKSTIRELLKRSIMDRKQRDPNTPYPYFLTAAPDGEWAGYQESVKSDSDAARKMKEDYKQAIKEGGSMFTPEYVSRIATSVKNLAAPNVPLNFVDIGGKLSMENRLICENTNGVILLSGEKAVQAGENPEGQDPEMVPREWKEFFDSLGIPIIAMIYSDYDNRTGPDYVQGVGDDGVYRASAHYLERGELDFQSRDGVKGLGEFVTTMQERVKWSQNVRDSIVEMSRTAGGVSDTSSSPDKPALILNSTALAEKTTENLDHALAYLWQNRDRQFGSPEEMRMFIDALAQKVSDGMLDPKQSLYRTWETAFNQTPPDQLEASHQQFCEWLAGHLNDDDAKEVAAIIEKRVDGEIHPFADGCGRTAKLLASYVLMREKLPPTKYPSREEYYSKIRGTDEEWIAYYKSLAEQK